MKKLGGEGLKPHSTMYYIKKNCIVNSVSRFVVWSYRPMSNASTNKCHWEGPYFKWNHFIMNAEAYSSIQCPFTSSRSEKRLRDLKNVLRRSHTICQGRYTTGKLGKYEK